MQGFGIVMAAFFGLLLGSFANVIVYRVPRGESITSPGSHCTSCGHAVRWYDNIPVVSWLLLRGRCRDCGAAISARYPLVEAASGLLFLLAALLWGVSVRAFFGAVFFWFLLVLSLIDAHHRRLPNVLVASLALLGVLGACLSQVVHVPAVPLTPLAARGLLSAPLGNAVAGALIGVAISGGTAALYALVRHKRGLGMGDVKFLGALGLFLGPYVLLSLFFGSLLGMVFGLATAHNKSLAEARIPFGPWLAAGSVIAAAAGPALYVWYCGIAGLS